ncbi:hypothetical protein Saa2_09328 [Streptomyces acidiscabies]|nr:hypothetical protein Saa2_09328 [Streptomyces acidiscabies]
MDGVGVDGDGRDGVGMEGASVGAGAEGTGMERASVDGVGKEGASVEGMGVDGASSERAGVDGASVDGVGVEEAGVERPGVEGAGVIDSREALVRAVRAGGKVKYLHFWGHRPSADGRIGAGCLSQWWESPFTVDGVDYATAEHWMVTPPPRKRGGFSLCLVGVATDQPDP